MAKPMHAAIAEQAYMLWLNDGMMHGKADHHWAMAEKLLAAEAPVAPKPAKARKAPAAKTAPRLGKARPTTTPLHS